MNSSAAWWLSGVSSTVSSLLAVSCLVACSADSASSHGGSGAGVGGFAGTAAAGASGIGGNAGASGIGIVSGGAGGMGTGTAAQGGSGGDDAGMSCAGETSQAKATPVDIYIMMDESASMNLPAGSGTRWSAITQAMQMFLMRPEATGLGVGIQYFGLSCNAPDYATPDVEIAELPGNAGMINTSIGAHGPVAVTPTTPALQGALMHAQSWKMAHPDHTVVVLLATDGEPDLCGAIDSVAMAAATGLAGTPSIATYVIGVGSGLMALNQVAASGGTGQATIVDSSADAVQQFIDALEKIRMSATLPCQYAIPAANGGGMPDPDKVNVTFADPAGAHTILRAPDMTKCDPTAGGWYYDNPTTPKTIDLCPATCTTVTQTPTASLTVTLGCKTQVIMVD